MNKASTLIALVAMTVVASMASAATITFTGNETDFTGAGVVAIQADGIDTEGFCGGSPLDIGTVYVTNDATTLYLGFQYNRACFCDMQLGIAFNTKAGGTTSDPFSHQVDWSLAPSGWDFFVYDVIPTSCNGFNYEVLYKSTGPGSWSTVADGSNGLGIVDTDGGSFVEYAIPLSTLEVSCSDAVQFELFTTQEGNSKPGFDFVANDSQQNSTGSGTCFDAAPAGCGFISQPTSYLNYVTADCPTPTRSSTWGSVKSIYR